MKLIIHKTSVAAACMAASLFAQENPSTQTVKEAAHKLAQQNNYSWTTTVEMAGGPFRPGPTEGKTEKNGLTMLAMTRGDNTIDAVIKGDKGAIKLPDQEWQSFSEAAESDSGGGPNPGRFISRMLRNYKTPAGQVEAILPNVKSLTKTDDAYSGELTEQGAKDLMFFGRRRGGQGPEISGAKGSVKFWVKDGILSKTQYHVTGTVSFNGNDRDIDRTTTTEIKNVGTTKVELPEAAKKKIS